MARFKENDIIRKGEMVKTIKGVLHNAYVFDDNYVMLFDDESEWEKVPDGPTPAEASDQTLSAK